jgi:diguanylate cyclase (GGDEF)-like protein
MIEIATHFFNKLSHTIVALYALTLSIVAIGTAFALHQNWSVRLESTQVNLVRNANIGNVLIEGALLDAGKTLRSTRSQLELAFLKGRLSNLEIHNLLKASAQASDAYKNTHKYGLMFYVDLSGLVYARSDIYLSRPIDMSDRFYYTDLLDNINKTSTVGPLLKARTTGQWVFHTSISMHDAHGKFAGVLVQQILVAAIAADLGRATDTSGFEQMMTHYPGSAVSFVYPPPEGEQALAHLASAIDHAARPSTRKEGASTWVRNPGSHGESLLMGYAQSTLMGLTTYVTVPMQQVWQKFLKDNLLLMGYSLVGALLISGYFLYLYRMSQQLVEAQISSQHDALTQLHNRRALDEQLPKLLRESMREQTPLTVLFIDIDHFRIFNERYGHESGDVALQAVAQALASVCQRPLDFICRWGGEEFVAVLPNTNATAALKLAQDMLTATRALQLSVPHHAPPRISVSIGHITHTVTRSTLEDDLVGAADRAMLQAKHQGRNQSVVARSASPTHNGRITFHTQSHP